MQPVRLTKHLTTASANCIAASQTLAAAGNFVLNGGSVTAGVATLDTQRRVAIVSGGNDSSRTATIYGTREGNAPIWESLALTNAGTAISVLDYLTVGTVAASGAIATTVTIGTCGTGSTPFLMPNFHLTPFSVDINTELTSSVGYNVETTQDDYWTAGSSYDATPQPHVLKVIDGTTIAAQVTLEAAVTGYRYTVISGTGTLSAQSTQAGIANY